MSQIEAMRVVDNPEEILQIFLQLMEEKPKVLLWQQEPEKERVIIHGTYSEVNEVNKMVTILKANECRELDFNKDVPIFLREDSSNTLLQASIDSQSRKIIEFVLPDTIKTRERRSAERKAYAEDGSQGEFQHAFFTLRSKVNQQLMEFDFPMLDLSITGVSIKVPLSAQKHFIEGEEITIKRLQQKDLAESVTGKIVYISKIENAQKLHVSQYVRVGVQFSSEIVMP